MRKKAEPEKPALPVVEVARVAAIARWQALRPNQRGVALYCLERTYSHHLYDAAAQARKPVPDREMVSLDDDTLESFAAALALLRAMRDGGT